MAVGLESSRYYTLGCRKLYVATDHKPLLAILNDRALDTIVNPRLLRIKERTLAWQFDLVYVPGNRQAAADTLSRKKSVAVLAHLYVAERKQVEIDDLLQADMEASLLKMSVIRKPEPVDTEHELKIMSVEAQLVQLITDNMVSATGGN